MSTPQWRRAGRLLATFGLAAPLMLALPASPASAAINAADFQQVTLAKGVAEMGEPMSLAVLPDRSVLHTARNGTLRRTDANGNTSVVANIAVYTHDEEGLQGVAVDPNFSSNRYIYLYYAPPLSTPSGDAPSTGTNWSAWQGVNRLSRFTLTTSWQLEGEQTILDVPADRGICCHVGGDIDFDAAGNLYLSTGDDTNPFQSDGYSPIDERTDRNPAFDAQRTSANTNDLRGKILRIKVNADGSYSVPSGNLFVDSDPKTRPEIYAMGFRNPFRMSVDKATGAVYVGDYGPDAGSSTSRGPSGQVEFNRITSPGNYGWPYCTGTNTSAETYAEWDFATATAGAKYNCTGGPTNNSFRNTGLTTLPAARPAWIRYAGDAGSPPEFGSGSESPMAGPVYRYNASSTSTVKFPQSLDGTFFAGEFGRRWIKAVTVNSDGSRGTIESFPWSGTQVMDMAFGPDGALYVLDYGTGFFGGDANSGLYRIEYAPGGKAPIAKASADKTSGKAPLTVNFSSAGSSDPENGALTYSWNFGDGTSSTSANPSKTYTSNGVYTATLTVKDPTDRTATASVTVTVGNTAPTVTFTVPKNGQVFSFGDTVPYQVSVSDPEDATIDCTRVKVSYILGHDSHGHQITNQNGCSGSITIPTDGEHDANANIFAVFDAEYTDNGANGQPALTTHTQHTLQPRTRQAEHYGSMSGVNAISKSTAHGGKTVGDISNGDWIAFEPYHLLNVTGFTARVSSGGAGGTLEVRSGSPTGTLLGSATVGNTGGWETFVNVNGTITGLPPGGPTKLHLVFRNAASTGALFDVDDFTLTTGSATVVQAEAYGAQSGVQKVAHLGAHGNTTVGYIDNGDWISFANQNLSTVKRVGVRVSSAGAGGTIEFRAGSSTGALLGTATVPVTGGWETYAEVSAALSTNSATTLVLVFKGGTGALFDVDDFTVVR
jgi:glucose/arabinose dehydrogenase